MSPDVPMHDVTIVGGGPGGLYAAGRLAARGYDVAVLEEHGTFGQPVHCTGVLADEVFDELQIPRDAVLNSLSTARFHSPSGLQISYTMHPTEAVVIDRLIFDRLLSTRAREAGAQLMSGSRATAIEVSRESACVQIEGRGSVRSRAVVLACGANYSFQRRLGLGMPSIYLGSAQRELPCTRGGDVELYFGSDAAPRGFAWAVPVARPSGPHVRIGLMSEGNAAQHFPRLLETVGSTWGVSSLSGELPRRRLLPLGAIRRTYGDRLVAVGDAAGLVKPTTGGGIYYSIVSAGIAAEVLDDALRRDDLRASRLAPYESRWKKRLVPEFRAQLALRMLAQRMSDEELDALFRLAQSDGIMPIVYRTARFNRHRDLIVALFRHPPARRLLFRRLVG